MTKRILAGGIVLAAGAVYFWMLAVTLPHLTDLTGGVPVFDLRPTGYSLEEARQILLALGETGRLYYLNVQQSFDMVFPFLNAAAAAIALAAVFRGGNWRWFRLGRTQHALLLMAICLPVVLFDLLENLTVRGFLMDPAAVSAEAVSAASRFTILKSVAVTFAYCLVLIGLIFLLVDKVRTKRAGMRSASVGPSR